MAHMSIKSAAAALVVLAFVTSAARAADSPVVRGIYFSPATVVVGDTTKLTVTLTNPNATPMSSPVFYVSPPGPLALDLVTPYDAAATCSAQVAQTNSVLLYNVTVAANSTCTVTATLRAVRPGTFTYSAGPFYGTPPTLDFTDTTVRVLTTAGEAPALSPWSLVLLALTIAAIACRPRGV